MLAVCILNAEQIQLNYAYKKFWSSFCFYAGDSVSQNDFSSEAPISLNLSRNICNPT